LQSKRVAMLNNTDSLVMLMVLYYFILSVT